eukprot:scaffold4958_cov406-Prasinococcus_capsulatus_cf.AAC.13
MALGAKSRVGHSGAQGVSPTVAGRALRILAPTVRARTARRTVDVRALASNGPNKNVMLVTTSTDLTVNIEKEIAQLEKLRQIQATRINSDGSVTYAFVPTQPSHNETVNLRVEHPLHSESEAPQTAGGESGPAVISGGLQETIEDRAEVAEPYTEGDVGGLDTEGDSAPAAVEHASVGSIAKQVLERALHAASTTDLGGEPDSEEEVKEAEATSPKGEVARSPVDEGTMGTGSKQTEEESLSADVDGHEVVSQDTTSADHEQGTDAEKESAKEAVARVLPAERDLEGMVAEKALKPTKAKKHRKKAANAQEAALLSADETPEEEVSEREAPLEPPTVDEAAPEIHTTEAIEPAVLEEIVAEEAAESVSTFSSAPLTETAAEDAYASEAIEEVAPTEEPETEEVASSKTNLESVPALHEAEEETLVPEATLEPATQEDTAAEEHVASEATLEAAQVDGTTAEEAKVHEDGQEPASVGDADSMAVGADVNEATEGDAVDKDEIAVESAAVADMHAAETVVEDEEATQVPATEDDPEQFMQKVLTGQVTKDDTAEAPAAARPIEQMNSPGGLSPVVQFVWPYEGERVQLAGSFNGWTPVDMERCPNSGSFVMNMALDPGRYEVSRAGYAASLPDTLLLFASRRVAHA